MNSSGNDVIIVTGAARGIGAAAARALARPGLTVVINYREQHQAAASLRDEIREMGGGAEIVAADIACEQEVATLFEHADRFGRLAGLVNNAGVTGAPARITDVSLATWERVFSVNVTGSFLCARAAIARFVQHGRGGNIVNVSSRAAQIGGGGAWSHYAASKGAIDTFTVGLAREWAAHNIRVNAVRPGLIDTEIHGKPLGGLERFKDMVPMGRIGRAEEVGQVVAWLFSPQASYMTGALLDIGGGW